MQVSPSQFRKFRRMNGFTRQELAERSGHAEITIQRIELGSRIPNVEVLADFATAMQVDITDFYDSHTEADYDVFEDLMSARNITPDDEVFARAEQWTMIAAMRRARRRAAERQNGDAA